MMLSPANKSPGAEAMQGKPHAGIIGNEGGFILALAMFMLAICMLLGIAAMNTSVDETDISTNEVIVKRVFTLAESGLEEIAVGQIESTGDELVLHGTCLEAAMADRSRAVVVDRVEATEPLPVLVSFGGLANGTDDPPFEFVRQTGDLGVHRVFVRDLGQCWYQQGLPGAADGVLDAAAALTRVIDELGPSRRVFVGNSSGAFAAILFGVLAGADEVAAFGPLA